MRKVIKNKHDRALIILAISSLFWAIFPSQLASAAQKNCDSTAGYKTVGTLQLGKIKLPVVPFTYPKGGIMDPPATTAVAAISTRHASINSISGSQIILWHRDYNGCIGKLNTLVGKSVGKTFTITDPKRKTISYTIRKTFTVNVGEYKKEWFLLNGLPQVVLVTCTGKFVNGHHTQNFVAIATPT